MISFKIDFPGWTHVSRVCYAECCWSQGGIEFQVTGWRTPQTCVPASGFRPVHEL
jgi:hypothetical protein